MRWMASFADVVLIVRLNEPYSRFLRRLRREVDRIGPLRLLDVLAFKILHQLKHGAEVQDWIDSTIKRLRDSYPPAVNVEVIEAETVNSDHVRRALVAHNVDFVIARCKQIIGKKTFTLAQKGVFVLHPGICPEYRNAHGCFWALARADYANVGTTLLKIDEGVDTGPVYGYFRTAFDLQTPESPLIIQERTLFDNLPAVRDALVAALNETAVPIKTDGRPSAVWGQPWYTAWRRFSR